MTAVEPKASRGWKESGLGYRAGGPYGILKFCRQQAITAPRLPTQKSEMLWYSVEETGPVRPGGDAGLRRAR
jgi:hypothetical protein